MAVKIVTDSTCDLPAVLAEKRGVTVVPAILIFDDQEYKDGIDMGPDEFYSRLLSSPKLPTTANPPPGDFRQAWQPLLDTGHDILSIHLSEKFSGTLSSARQARMEMDTDRIAVIDSAMASAGLGLLALAAARKAGEGASLDEVREYVEEAKARTHCYFLLDTLEYLHKGGRIGAASAFLGSLLKVKPILMIKNGEAHPASRARTRSQGLQKLVETLRGLAPAEGVCVVHSTAPEDAETVRGQLQDLAPGGDVVMARFGPVVGVYLGPGVVGVGLISAPDAP